MVRKRNKVTKCYRDSFGIVLIFVKRLVKRSNNCLTPTNGFFQFNIYLSG